MGSTFVPYRAGGFEANDAALEVWLLLLVEAIDQLAEVPDWLSQARADWQLQATAGFGFGVVPELDELITSAARRDLILALCERALKRLRAYGDIIPRAELNRISQATEQAYFTRDAETAFFLETGEAFIRLLRDAPDQEDELPARP